MQILFTKWCLDPKGRTDVTVEPKRVDCVEFYSEPFQAADNKEDYPACSKIIMQNRLEYLVQGSVKEIQRKLNDTGLTISGPSGPL